MTIRVQLFGGEMDGKTMNLDGLERPDRVYVPVYNGPLAIASLEEPPTVELSYHVVVYRRRNVRYTHGGMAVLNERGWPYDFEGVKT